MIKINTACLAFGIFNLVAKLSFAGGMTSSGGEFITTEKNPWFVGDSPVSYCVEKGPDFSATLEVSKKAVAEAINDWVTHLRVLKPEPTEFKLPDGTQKNISLNFLEVPCSASPDLHFYLGTFTPLIEETLRHLARYTAAFAGRTDFDEKTGRGRGVIWLAPDLGAKAYLGPAFKSFWSSETILYNVVLHELGHVFGFEHQPDGIMNEGAPAEMVQSDKYPKLSTEVYLSYLWRVLGKKVCGDASEDQTDLIKEILGVPYIIRWRICITPPAPESVSATSDYQIEFISEKNIVDRKLGFISFSLDDKFLPSRQIVGKYFENSINSNFKYTEHTFVSLSQSKISGFLRTDTKSLPLIIETDGPMITMTIIKDSTFQKVWLFIDDFDPRKIRSSSVLK